MAKNKNPLKDLNEFLNQQASSFVSPNKVQEEKQVPKTLKETIDNVESGDKVLSVNELLQQFTKSDSDFRPKLYDALIEALEKSEQSTANDKLLVNTLLYLKNPEDWRSDIAEYWAK